MKTKKALRDLTSEKFGRLTVLYRAEHPDNKRAGGCWLCRCECGTEKVIRGGGLLRQYGATRSCGCSTNVTHGHSRRKENRTPAYRSWIAMRTRCFNTSRAEYPLYGGRGITVCERWKNSFAAFLEDMGERPDGHTLDRIDMNSGYEPGNCRWATATEQSRNRRSTKLTVEKAREIRELAGAGTSYSDIAKSFGVFPASILGVVQNETWREAA